MMMYSYRVKIECEVNLNIQADDLTSADMTAMSILGTLDDPDLECRAEVDREAYEWDFRGTTVTMDPCDVDRYNEGDIVTSREDIMDAEDVE